MRWLLPLWMVVATSSCLETYLREELPGGTYTVTERESRFEAAQDDRAPIHPAVVEALLARPELPWSWNGHVSEEAASERTEVARAIAPALSEGLAARGDVHLRGPGFAMQLTVSRRAEILFVRWSGSDGGLYARFALDLRDVEGAFEPGATLDVATVERRARFRSERSP